MPTSRLSRPAQPERRIGVDLNVAVRVDGPAATCQPALGFEAFIAAQREAGARLFLFETEREGAAPARAGLTECGFFKGEGQGGLGFAPADVIAVAGEREKTAKLEELGATHMIGAGGGYFAGDSFPDNVQAVALGQEDDGSEAVAPVFPDWSEVGAYFQWEHGFKANAGARLAAIKPIKEHGRNYVYQLIDRAGHSLILKRRFEGEDGGRDRFRVEESHLGALREAGVGCVPELRWRDGDWALYERIPGSPVTEPGEDDARQLAEFLTALDEKRQVLREKGLAQAVDARLRLADYADAVNSKWNRTLQACQRPGGSKETMMFMLTDLEQLRQDNLNNFYLCRKREQWDAGAELPEALQFFNPGEVGFHNAVKTPEGRLVFLDFERSGWDDPAKLMADFFYNPEQRLDLDLKLSVLEAFAKGRADDPGFLKRFYAVSDLVAVEWILKTLEVAVPEEMRRLQFLIPDLDTEGLLRERLETAAAMRERFQPMETICQRRQLLDSSAEL